MPDTLATPTTRKKQADGKSPREAMRCLKRRLARVVYNNLTTDHHARTHEAENPTPAAA